MPNPQITGVIASGLYQISPVDIHEQGATGWLVSIQPKSDFGGNISVGQYQVAPNQTPVPTVAAQLTAVPCTNLATGVTDVVGAPYAVAVGQTAAINLIVNTASIYGLWAAVTWYAGTLRIIVTPYSVPVTPVVNFSTVVIDSIPSNYDDAFELVAALQDAGNLTDA